MNTKVFREELKKIMPGYKWTVHRNMLSKTYIDATGTQSSGFNRTSTLNIMRSEQKGIISYIARSLGFGKNARWLYTYKDETLSKALRGLQNSYEESANNYFQHVAALEKGRKEKNDNPTKKGT
ncbi:MAG: hypothetical protein JJW03_05230 [Desulfosarcina sp.]|nr:hypothetical protein [Desulfobacterales bacterium]